jgi:uncharacterized Tic20 family protein/DNA-directed RNA polymerase subunit RPC12/RpoP
MVLFGCPTCGARLQHPQAGEKVSCPHCGQRILVPAAPPPKPAAGNPTVLGSWEDVPPPVRRSTPAASSPADKPPSEGKLPDEAMPADEPPDEAMSADELPEESAAELTQEEKQWGMFCHLASLLGLLVGGITFLGPLVCWLVKKDSSKFVDYNGKESLNFQINILLYVLLSIPIAIVTCGFGFVLTIAIVVYGIVMPIIAGIKASSGERYRYRYTFRLIQ